MKSTNKKAEAPEYSKQSQITALQTLAQFRGELLVVMYRNRYQNCRVYAGGMVYLTDDGRQVWDKNSVEITSQVAIAIKAWFNETDGIKMDNFYTGRDCDGSLGAQLVWAINNVTNGTLGYPIFDSKCVCEVNAWGTIV